MLNALCSWAAIFHQGNEYSLLGTDVSRTEKWEIVCCVTISPVPAANISIVLFIRIAIAFQPKEKCISVLTEPVPSRILLHKAMYKYELFVQPRLFTIRFSTQLCQINTLFVLWILYCASTIWWTPHSHWLQSCFVDYCHLDFNVITCKPSWIMPYLSYPCCCFYYCMKLIHIWRGISTSLLTSGIFSDQRVNFGQVKEVNKKEIALLFYLLHQLLNSMK